ncbi:prolyl-tRNA editing enzyme YbaK/EbsC (Cys-tRNA(Pro) deacylase) [Elusimicrobium simillimum]|uniref:YbaK/EbsC family protein n=1 Tax=Elusimicrobium simillimum TaxID=3143438 RepID=UPI003C6F578D
MIPENVQKFLDTYNLTAIEFAPGSTATAVTAAAQLGVEVGQIAKSLLFKNKEGKYFLVLCAGDKKVSSAKIKEITGSKTGLSTPQETLEVTGFAIGGVCPFGVSGVPVYIDKSLEAYTTVYPAAGTAESAVKTSYSQLLQILGAAPCDVTI